MKKVLEENQPREQASFRKGGKTVDHLQTIDHLMERSCGFGGPLCIGYIDCKGAYGSNEHEAIFKALRSIGINEIYITTLEDTYTGATERVRMDNQISE